MTLDVCWCHAAVSLTLYRFTSVEARRRGLRRRVVNSFDIDFVEYER